MRSEPSKIEDLCRLPRYAPTIVASRRTALSCLITEAQLVPLASPRCCGFLSDVGESWPFLTSSQCDPNIMEIPYLGTTRLRMQDPVGKWMEVHIGHDASSILQNPPHSILILSQHPPWPLQSRTSQQIQSRRESSLRPSSHGLTCFTGDKESLSRTTSARSIANG